MSSGLYNALSGAKAQMQVLDITANNLANANTVAFKTDRTSFETMLKQAGDPT
ncbi:MAG: flagellar basal body protein, partial [Trichloromonadaceae bacterium]